MTKQTFTIHEGCKAVTVEQVGNQIITTFEPEFKRGDVLIPTMGYICILDEIKNKNEAFEIVGVIKGEITYNNKSLYFGYTQNLRLATTEEAQPLWDALAKEGKRWNPETMQVEPIKKELVVVVAGEKLEAGDLVSIKDGKAQKVEPFTVTFPLEFNEEMQTLQVNIPDDTVIEKGIIIDGVTYPLNPDLYITAPERELNTCIGCIFNGNDNYCAVYGSILNQECFNKRIIYTSLKQ